MCAAAGTAMAGSSDRVVSTPVPVLEQPRRGADVVMIAQRGTVLEVVGRENEWCWVLLPPDQYGTRRAGWLRCAVLDETPRKPAVPLVGASASRPSAAPTTEDVEPRGARGGPLDGPVTRIDENAGVGAPGRARASSRNGAVPNPGAPPLPVGMENVRTRSTFATWFQPRMLRAAVNGGYEAATNGSAGSDASDRILMGGVTVSTSFAILDPRIATFDFTGDFQTGHNNRAVSASTYRNANTLQSYRFDAAFLSGRSAPLRVFSDRVSTDTSTVPLTSTLDPSQFTHGVRTSTGFTWDVTVPHKPRVQVSASTGRQSDARDYLFGYNSYNDEQRAEFRVTQDLEAVRYDVALTHVRFVYDVPDAGVRTDTGNDLLSGTVHLRPSQALSLDVSGRMSRYDFGLTNQQSRVTGLGGDLAGRYRFSAKLNASGRYSFSSNAFEAILSGAVGPNDARAATGASPTPLATNTRFQDGEGRVEFGTPRASIAAISRVTAYGVPAWQPLTLGGLRTVGALARAERRVKGFTVTGAVDGSVGTAASNRSQLEPYREAGVQAGAAREWAQRFRFSVDGALRGVGRLSFYPVNLDARSLTGSVETTMSSWARARLAVTWSNNLRDILYNDNKDHHIGYTFGVSGRWYDVAVDINRLSTRSILLGADVIAGRPDVALLLSSGGEIYRNVFGSTDQNRALSVTLRPWPGLQLNGRVVRQSQQYPSVFDLFQEGEQAWAVWQLRQLQLEFGWERLASTSSFSVIDGRRIYIRVRRDLTFF
jgi:hypothetical protein